jgi:hypothetical protein
VSAKAPILGGVAAFILLALGIGAFMGKSKPAEPPPTTITTPPEQATVTPVDGPDVTGQGTGGSNPLPPVPAPVVHPKSACPYRVPSVKLSAETIHALADRSYKLSLCDGVTEVLMEGHRRLTGKDWE